ncbi:Oidioi.mRNA.OKI2018_I69.chr1.g445.t1.cds [Oikopleura dioica]|uniref:Oidioi.mRNA.OKI2018_I69.chr1.g445.t1.cds n=1 Tax=Oikopleura dioica TaxID=34765 RepID=A0ABN7SNR0_OIKDI|nr:Oidioi.mRNA.OKI2018_I69.chr1.g445.t1.cds [Oikopleura dioica]
MKIFKAASLISAAAATCSWKQDKKPNRCNDVSYKMTKTNTWVCKDCFNYRIEFQLRELNMNWWWTHDDFMYMTFDEPVTFITAAHPVDNVELHDTNSAGDQIYKISFKDGFVPGDGRIDFNIQFREDNLTSHATAGHVCPNCYDLPKDGTMYAQFIDLRDIVLSSAKKSQMNHNKYINLMNRVNGFFTSHDEIIIDRPAIGGCRLPFWPGNYGTDSYETWKAANNDELERLRTSDSLADTCAMIDLIEEYVLEIAKNAACLDKMPDRKKAKFADKIQEISWSKSPNC